MKPCKTYSVPEAAKIASVSAARLRRAVAIGTIPSLRYGERIRIKESDLPLIHAQVEDLSKPIGSLNVSEVADALGISVHGVRQLIRAKVLKAKKIGIAYYITEEEAERVANEGWQPLDGDKAA